MLHQRKWCNLLSESLLTEDKKAKLQVSVGTLYLNKELTTGWDPSLQLSKECEPDLYFPFMSPTSVCSHLAESQTICIILWVCEGL